MPVHSSKAYAGEEVWLHEFSVSAIDRDDWSTSRTDRLILGERDLETQRIGSWVGPSGHNAERKTFCTCCKQNDVYTGVQSAA